MTTEYKPEVGDAFHGKAKGKLKKLTATVTMISENHVVYVISNGVTKKEYTETRSEFLVLARGCFINGAKLVRKKTK